MADSKLTALSEVASPDLSDISYWVATPGGTPASHKIRLAQMLGPLKINHFRLSLVSGNAYPTTDQIGKSNLYLTPLSGAGSGILTVPGTNVPEAYSSAELSLALSGVTSGKNYDVFGYLKSGAPVIDLGTAWTNDTTRALSLDGAGAWETNHSSFTSVIAGDLVVANAGVLLGSIRTTGTTTTEDSAAGATSGNNTWGRRFVWNRYNRRSCSARAHDSTASWTYNSTTYRQANNSANARAEILIGLVQDEVRATAFATINSAAVQIMALGIGVDSATTNSAQIFGGAGGATYFQQWAQYRGFPAAGYHQIEWLEASQATGTTTWYGVETSGLQQSGLMVDLWT